MRRGTGAPLRKGDMLPRREAIASLVIAIALQGHLAAAMLLYAHVRAETPALALSHPQMYEQLLELNCRSGAVDAALQVFDDWKAARDELMCEFACDGALDEGVLEGGEDAAGIAGNPQRGLPRLSTVSLAFLEACCHAQSVPMWRVYDVLAAMRDQHERQRMRELAQPAKSSHHFLEE